MIDLMEQLDKLERFNMETQSFATEVMIQRRRGKWVRFEQVKTVIGQWVADNSDLLAAQAEVTRLRDALASIERNSHEPLTIHVAREALAPKDPS